MVDLDEILRHKEDFKGLIEKYETSDPAGYATNVGDLMGIYFYFNSERSGALSFMQSMA
jgi:hypothetical protein